MKKSLKLFFAILAVSNMLNAAMVSLDTTALQKVRDVCGTYFGTASPLTSLANITDAQVTTKLSATDLKNITDLLTSASTFFQGTTYLTELTTFSTKIQTLQTQSSQINADLTAISSMNISDLTAKVGTLTSTTAPQILTAAVTRIGALFDARTTTANQTKDYYTGIINMLKAAQAKFTTDTSYTGKALQAAIESTSFETDKITALKNIFSDTTYINYAKTTRAQ